MDKNKRIKFKNLYFGKNEMKRMPQDALWQLTETFWLLGGGLVLLDIRSGSLPPSASLAFCPSLLRKALHREKTAVTASYWSLCGTDAQGCKSVPPEPQNHFPTHSENILLSTFSWNLCCRESLVFHILGRKWLITKYYPCINDL